MSCNVANMTIWGESDLKIIFKSGMASMNDCICCETNVLTHMKIGKAKQSKLNDDRLSRAQTRETTDMQSFSKNILYEHFANCGGGYGFSMSTFDTTYLAKDVIS